MCDACNKCSVCSKHIGFPDVFIPYCNDCQPEAVYDRTEEASFHYDVRIHCGTSLEFTEENYFANESDAKEWAYEQQITDEPNRRYVVVGCFIDSLEGHDERVAQDWRYHQDNHM